MDEHGRRAAPASAVARTRVVAAAAIVGGAAAVLAAPLFVATVATGGWRQPGYDQWSTFVSELGASGSPAAALTNAGFVLVGLCLGAFAVGVAVALPSLRRVGALLVVPGLSFVVLAASPCSAGCPIALVDAGATTADAIHNAAATAGLVAVAIAALTVADRAPAGFGPSWYGRFSAVAGAVVALTAGLFGAAVLVHAEVAVAVSERAMLGAAMAWNTVTGAALLRHGLAARSGRGERVRRASPATRSPTDQ